MARKSKTVDAGIYEATYITLSGHDMRTDSRVWRELSERSRLALDFDGHLLPIACDTAQAVLDLHENDNWPKKSPDEEIREEAARVASMILGEARTLEGLRKKRKKADRDLALAFAFQIGDNHRRLRMLIGPARLAKITKKNAANLKKANEDEHGKLDDNVEATVKTFKRIKNKDREQKIATVVKKTAAELGIGESTVYKHRRLAKQSTLRR